MKKIIRGKVFKYGDDVNTDVIFPGKYTYTVKDPKEMAKYALEDLDPDFAQKVERGDVIVAGKNFGCGSSREQAATCLVSAGVGAIVAISFSRIFYRNAINQGLPAIVLPELVKIAEPGEEIEIELNAHRITLKGFHFSFPPFPQFVMGILRDGGLLPHIRRRYV